MPHPTVEGLIDSLDSVVDNPYHLSLLAQHIRGYVGPYLLVPPTVPKRVEDDPEINGSLTHGATPSAMWGRMITVYQEEAHPQQTLF